MKNILITLVFFLGVSIVDAQSSRIVRLDENREVVISSEVLVSELDGDREANSLDLSNRDLLSDMDSDGLSDYLEKEVYFTDPKNASTVGDSKSDITKMLLGFDPLSETPLEVKYEDIRLDSSAVILKELSISDISILNKKVLLKGKGLPNSLTTIYIFDLDLVVFVKTDARGNWEYLLAKEIADTKYSVYLGVLNTEGSIVAKNDVNIFVQDKGGIVLNPKFDVKEINFFELFIKYALYIIISIFILGSLILGLLIWKNTKINEEG